MSIVFSPMYKMKLRQSYSKEVRLMVIEPGYEPFVMTTTADKTFMSTMWSDSADAEWNGPFDMQWVDNSMIMLRENDLIMFVAGHEERKQMSYEVNELAMSIVEKYRMMTSPRIYGTVYIVETRSYDGSVFEYEDLSEETAREVVRGVERRRE